MLRLRIVQEGPSWVVIDMPTGFHTHPPEDKSLRVNPRWNALGILERQLGRPLYPAHRLDRATSGLLLFSKEREANRALQEQFASGEVRKLYYALARGSVGAAVRAEAPLKSEAGEPQQALTLLAPSFSFPLPILHPRGGNRSFTLLEARPETGRFHQIRRHLAGLGFPIVGDSRHGDKKLNRAFAELTGGALLYLRCMGLGFRCPSTGEAVLLRARWSREWHRLFELAGACAIARPEAESAGG